MNSFQIRPNEIFNLLYSENIFGRSIFHAVLLQELLIHIAVFMSIFPVGYRLLLIALIPPFMPFFSNCSTASSRSDWGKTDAPRTSIHICLSCI